MARSSFTRWWILASLLAASACHSDPTNPGQRYEYVIDVHGETFIVRATDPATNRALDDRWRSAKSGVIAGRVAKGDGAFNAPWHWHLVPETVTVPDVTVELCDGRASMVEADVDRWMAGAKSFCPWSAVVANRHPYVPPGGNNGGP